MIITSSRKPSAKTRILCKRLTYFLNGNNVNRGKMNVQELFSLAGSEPLLIVGEFHGNPGELRFFKAGKLLFSIRISESYSKAVENYRFKNLRPVISGTGELADSLASFLSLERVKSAEAQARVLVVDDRQINFVDADNTLFKLIVKSFQKA